MDESSPNRQTKIIGAKWLRNGNEDTGRNTMHGEAEGWTTREKNSPPNQGSDKNGANQGNKNYPNTDQGVNSAFLKQKDLTEEANQLNSKKIGITVIESKKCRTDNGSDQFSEMDKAIEFQTGSDEEEGDEMDQDSNKNLKNIVNPKNAQKAGSGIGVYLVQ